MRSPPSLLVLALVLAVPRLAAADPIRAADRLFEAGRFEEAAAAYREIVVRDGAGPISWPARRFAASIVSTGSVDRTREALIAERDAARGRRRAPLVLLLAALDDARGAWASASEHLEQSIGDAERRLRSRGIRDRAALDGHLAPSLELLAFFRYIAGNDEEGAKLHARAAAHRLKPVREDPYDLALALANGARRAADPAKKRELLDRARAKLEAMKPVHPAGALLGEPRDR